MMNLLITTTSHSGKLNSKRQYSWTFLFCWLVLCGYIDVVSGKLLHVFQVNVLQILLFTQIGQTDWFCWHVIAQSVLDHSWFGIHWEVIVVVAHVVEKMRLDGTFCPTVEVSSFQHALLAFSQLHIIKMQASYWK